MGRQTRQSFFRPEQLALREVIAGLRQASGLSQRELSQRLGMAVTYMGRVERGERTVDVIEFLDIARATGTAPGKAFALLLERLGDDLQG